MALEDLATWMKDFALQYGYLGIFLVSLAGSASVIVPIPSSIVIFTLAGLPSFEPLLIAVAAGAGAAIGELSGYAIGLGGRRVIGEKYKKKMDLLMRLFKKFGPIVIFGFALTPLPDDLIFIPLGVMRYNIVHAFIPALIGKFLSNLIIAYAGRFFVRAIGDFFGVEGEGSVALIGIVLATVLLVVVLLIMFKVNWEKLAEKYLSETEKKAKDAKKEKESAAQAAKPQ
ncbi:MAG: YqaA family protein [Candidatus Bathyarchaeia archaeon]